MSTRGYTRRDHRHRKRRSKSRQEMLLDRLLKLFFYILVILVVVILIKIVFFNDKADSEKENESTNASTESSSQIGDGEDASNNESSTNVDDTEDTGNTTEEATTQEVTTQEPTTQEETTEKETEEYVAPPPYIPTGDYNVFDEAAFCGDSRIGGLYLSSQLVTSTFYYDVGGNVSNAVDGNGFTLNNGSSGSLIDCLRQRDFEYVFLQYGVNEWGWSTPGFVEGYKELINAVKAVQPNAKIYVLAIIPVTQSFDDARVEGVNASLTEKDNGIKAAAAELGVGYINIVEGITGGARVLGEGMSTDGYHLNRTENLKVLDYICNAIK